MKFRIGAPSHPRSRHYWLTCWTTIWGLAPGALAPWAALTLPGNANKEDDEPAWLTGVDAGWREWFAGKPRGFARKFELARRITRIPRGATNLDPVAHVRNLELLYFVGYSIRSLHDVPASSTLHTLCDAHTR